MAIRGIFEVHLITEPEFQPRLFGYCTNITDTKIIRPRPTCSHSLYGDYPVQPMLTFWIHGEIDEITKIVKNIELDMIEKQIPIIRSKIEAMVHNDNIPQIVSRDHYFEYHFKIKISNTKQWNHIVELIVPFGAHLFYNPYNKTLNPIVTIRRYTSLQDLDEQYLVIKNLLENHGYELTAPEKEYSVLDSNINLDKNWLFESEPTNFITKINNYMLFDF